MFGGSLLSAQSDCTIKGFWKSSQYGQISLQDFKEKEVLFLKTQNGVCNIVRRNNYTIIRDTIKLVDQKTKRTLKKLIVFISCDSLQLVNINQNGSRGAVSLLERANGHKCATSSTTRGVATTKRKKTKLPFPNGIPKPQEKPKFPNGIPKPQEKPKFPKGVPKPTRKPTLPKGKGTESSKCKLMGLWKGEENGQIGLQDFNHNQILVMTNESTCEILSFSSYTRKGDTLRIIHNTSGRVTTVVVEFVHCDLIHLISIVNGQRRATLTLERLRNHKCDYSENHFEKGPFFSRPAVKEWCFIIFTIVYSVIGVLWIFFYFKGDIFRRRLFWLLMALVAFIASYVNYVLFGLAVLHLSILVLRFLYSLSFMNALSRLAAFSFYAACIQLGESFMLFGMDQSMPMYLSVVAFINNIILLFMMFDFIRYGFMLGFSFTVSMFGGMAVSFLPQYYVYSNQENIVLWFKNIFGAIFRFT